MPVRMAHPEDRRTSGSTLPLAEDDRTDADVRATQDAKVES